MLPVLLLLTVALASGSPAKRRLSKAELEQACDQLKSAAATLAGLGVDSVCASTAAGTDTSGFRGDGVCAEVTTAADDISSAETCTVYNTKMIALCVRLLPRIHPDSRPRSRPRPVVLAPLPFTLAQLQISPQQGGADAPSRVRLRRPTLLIAGRHSGLPLQVGRPMLPLVGNGDPC